MSRGSGETPTDGFRSTGIASHPFTFSTVVTSKSRTASNASFSNVYVKLLLIGGFSSTTSLMLHKCVQVSSW